MTCVYLRLGTILQASDIRLSFVSGENQLFSGKITNLLWRGQEVRVTNIAEGQQFFDVFTAHLG